MPGGTALETSLKALRRCVEEAAGRAGRNPQDVRIVLATKTVPSGELKQAAAHGFLDFGENRVQELLKKKKEIPESLGVRWHMIGRLQTNKVKSVLGEVVMIQSLDRIELAREIQKQAEKRSLGGVSCLIEVNVSGEASKSGVARKDAVSFAERVAAFSRIRLEGLMTIGPMTENRDRIRQAFGELRELQETLKKKMPSLPWSVLSMGMSHDYPIAIEEGATMIRIGTAAFGARPRV